MREVAGAACRRERFPHPHAAPCHSARGRRPSEESHAPAVGRALPFPPARRISCASCRPKQNRQHHPHPAAQHTFSPPSDEGGGRRSLPEGEILSTARCPLSFSARPQAERGISRAGCWPGPTVPASAKHLARQLSASLYRTHPRKEPPAPAVGLALPFPPSRRTSRASCRPRQHHLRTAAQHTFSPPSDEGGGGRSLPEGEIPSSARCPCHSERGRRPSEESHTPAVGLALPFPPCRRTSRASCRPRQHHLRTAPRGHSQHR